MATAMDSTLQNDIHLIDTARNYVSEVSVGAVIALNCTAGVNKVVVRTKVIL